ncbi:MAG: GcrA cell cycle regulator [Hyphomicrobiales bacterium]|nr:GcrA cell cycle regulator [Hyphomicrobiales bacterium]MBV9053497.1 GcrA cell cycle regulator [Hyphomicrobiales bacterium]
MSWDGERVELLRKLWQEGISASRIAAQLGAGITRNAVIGKVHRLGLAGRAKPAAPSAAPRPRRVSPPSATQRTVALRGNTMMLREVVVAEEYEPAVLPKAVVIPISERVTITELRENMCRWPLGDPLTPEFRYCGTKCDPSASYCMPHGRMAYQQVPDRRRG